MRDARVGLQADHLRGEPVSLSAHFDKSRSTLAEKLPGVGGGSIRRGSGAGSLGLDEITDTDSGGCEGVAQAVKLAASASVASLQRFDARGILIGLLL